MYIERLGPPAEFAQRLAGYLQSIDAPQVPLPAVSDLTELIDVMFFASMHEEEGRRSTFNVAWQPGSKDCSALVAITTPVPVTPKNLAKLAPATQRDATSIAIRRTAEGLVAWALLQRSAAAAPPLTIWSLDPGVLRVDYAGISCALYARGEIWLQDEAQEVKSPSRHPHARVFRVANARRSQHGHRSTRGGDYACGRTCAGAWPRRYDLADPC